MGKYRPPFILLLMFEPFEEVELSNRTTRTKMLKDFLVLSLFGMFVRDCYRHRFENATCVQLAWSPSVPTEQHVDLHCRVWIQHESPNNFRLSQPFTEWSKYLELFSDEDILLYKWCWLTRALKPLLHISKVTNVKQSELSPSVQVFLHFPMWHIWH